MRVRTLIITAVLPAALALAGCGPTGTTGGSTGKATTSTTTTTDGKTDVKTEKVDGTFKIDTTKLLVPLANHLKQDESKVYQLSISRGKDFKEDVELSTEGPDKLKVELTPKKVEASSNGEFQMKVTAAADAPVGEHTIKLNAKPAHGETAHTDLKFKVDAKK